jgi:hypothetical protein
MVQYPKHAKIMLTRLATRYTGRPAGWKVTCRAWITYSISYEAERDCVVLPIQLLILSTKPTALPYPLYRPDYAA